MHKVVAFGGCHILSGSFKNPVNNLRDIVVDKSIPCQLISRTKKSIKLLNSYLKTNSNNQVTIVFQTGNIGFSNSIGNIIGFGTGRKMVRSLIPVTLNDNEFLQKTSVSTSSQPGLKTRLKQLFYLFIIPINFILINLLYIPRLIQFKNAIKKHSNVSRVLVLTPFCAFCNFHWIFRKYGAWVYAIIFKSTRASSILNMYTLTDNESLFTDDKLHLNIEGYRVLNQAICNKLFEMDGMPDTSLLNMAV